VSESDLIELGADEIREAVGSQFLQEHGVGYTVLDIFVDGERQAAEQLGLCDEDEAVILGEVLEEQTDATQGGDVHQVGVVDDGCEHFRSCVEASRLLDEALLAAEVSTVGFRSERPRTECAAWSGMCGGCG
jgi:hypothetical protein